MRVLRPHLGTDGQIAEVGAILKVNMHRAKELEQKKLAIPILDQGAINKLVASEVAEKSTSRPMSSPPIGSPIGEASNALSSPPDPPRAKRKYTRRKAKPES